MTLSENQIWLRVTEYTKIVLERIVNDGVFHNTACGLDGGNCRGC